MRRYVVKNSLNGKWIEDSVKILYITQFFYPESIAPSFRAYDNARLWQEAGESITVFTAYPNYPTGKVFDGYKVRLCQEEVISNVKVLRSRICVSQNKSFLSRIFNMSSFLFFGLINFIFNSRKVGKDYDMVLGTSGTIFAALLAWIYAAFHRLPFIFEIRDITYRQLIATGKSSSGFSVKLMKKLELFLCCRAQRVVVVTNGFRDVLSSDGIDEKKISVITNGVEISPLTEQEVARDGVQLSYFGTLGISQKIDETFPYAAEIARAQGNFTYRIIGEGAQRGAIETLLSDGSYPYIELLHGMTPEKLEAYYTQTNLSVVTLVKSENFKYTLPSKMFQIMGRGIAVLFIGPDGEAADIVRKYHAGIVLCGTPEEDMQVLRDFFAQPDYEEQLAQMGRNGYEAVARCYDRKTLAADYLDLLQTCSKGKRIKMKLKMKGNEQI